MPTTRAALYLRTSNLSLHNPDIFHDLRQTASLRGYQIVREFADRIGGTKAKRPALDQLLADARRGQFDLIIVGSLTDVAGSVRACLSVMDQLNQLGIGFVSCQESIDTSDTTMSLGIAAMVNALSALERNLRIQNVREGMRRAALDGVKIGRTPLIVDRAGLIQARLAGASLSECSKQFCVSRAYVYRVMKLVGGQANRFPPCTDDPFTLAESA